MTSIPALTIESGIKMGIVALCCAGLSILFCMALNGISAFYAKYLKNGYVRVVVASVAIIVITKLLGTTDYMGAGTGLIAQAIEHGNVRTLDFFWKLVLTVLTMRAGFRGGEIVPSFCIGATFGCVLGHILGLPHPSVRQAEW